MRKRGRIRYFSYFLFSRNTVISSNMMKGIFIIHSSHRSGPIRHFGNTSRSIKIKNQRAGKTPTD